jgi:hypothetical protein
MSKIHDDNDAVRQAERIAEQRRMEAKHRVDKQATDSAFARLVGNGQKPQGQVLHKTISVSEDARFSDKEAPPSAGRHGVLAARSEERKPNVLLQELMGQSSEKAESAQLGGQTLLRQQSEQAVTFLHGNRELPRAEVREQAKVGKKSVSETERQQESRSTQAKSDDKQHGEVKAENRNMRIEEKTSDMRQDSKRSGKETREDFGALFNSHPALMEPAPIVRPKSTGDSERLRKIASEIAQKIVERVRVGTNRAGNAEFQIDLRSDVLSGLSLRVSSSGGKINVVFSGSDRNALKLVEEQSEALRNALSVRGLTLTNIKLETIS